MLIVEEAHIIGRDIVTDTTGAGSVAFIPCDVWFGCCLVGQEEHLFVHDHILYRRQT